MSRYGVLIGAETPEEGALDVDLVRSEVVLVTRHGRELRFTQEQAETLALGLIKASDMLKQQALIRRTNAGG